MNEFRKQLDYIRELYGSVENYITKEFGENVPFSIVGDFCLVHLDSPGEAEIRRREIEFDPDEHFPDDCPICEMERETGGFIIFEKQPEDEFDDEEAEFEDIIADSPSVEPPESIWRRSYLDLNGLANAQAELKVTILLQNIWGNIVELKEDSAGRDNEAATVLAFEEAYRHVAKATYYYLNAPGTAIHWQELEPLYAKAHATASSIRVDQCDEKVEDLRRKMKALEKFFLEVVSARMLK